MGLPLINEKIKLIQDEARRLGFEGFGITTSDMGMSEDHLRNWLNKNFDGEMAYIKRGEEKRLDLQKVLPDVKSVICLSTNYFPQGKDMSFLEDHENGDISLYALNKDYHDVITPRLRELEEVIKGEFDGCNTRGYVDTGPILEKPLAEKAGLGWIGKHTNLLTEGIGSWYFLSEILVDIELPISEPGENHCGTCTSCIDICPTKAIIAPYVLDSRRCISYLTIELKGMIPLEFRKDIGTHIYGCDDCQIVCPWNSYAHLTGEEDFKDKGLTRLLMDLIQLDDSGFRERFRKSPVKRIKRRGLIRNVAVVLGNIGNVEAVPHLTSLLNDPEPLIRGHCVWALGEILKEKAQKVLKNTLYDEKHPWVLEEIQYIQKSFPS
ncbi:MAG: tRNA epoxyqueuosine(34) reductase QueG [Nitrospinales bacterium]